MQLLQRLVVATLILLASEINRLRYTPACSFFASSSKLFPNHQIKANHKMQSLNSFTKPIIMKKSTMPTKVTNKENDDDLLLAPCIEIFVRKHSVGLWIRLKKKCIYCGISNETTIASSTNSNEYYHENKQINKIFTDLNCLSGIEEEVQRDTIDKWISLRLFTDAGLGGERNFIQQVKILLPQFKKLKPKEFEFGYRYIPYQDTSPLFNSVQENSETAAIDRNQSPQEVYSLISKERERISAKIAKSNEDQENITNDQTAVWNSSELLRLCNPSIKDSVCDDKRLQSLLTISQQKALVHIQSVADRMFQSLQEPQSVKHLDVFFDGSAYFSKSKMTDGSAKSPADTLCVKAGAGVYIVPRDDDSYILNSKVAARKGWPICVHSASALVSTPFDAELLAGLAAVTILSNIVKSYALMKQTPSITIFSDSKTMCRVFRLIDNSKASKPDESSPLYNRGEPYRQLMWDLLCEHVRYILKHIDLRGSSEYELTRWVAGHPERRKLPKEWNFYDTGIWSADEIARGSEGLLNVLNIQSNNDNDNNSKVVDFSENCESSLEGGSVGDESDSESGDDLSLPKSIDDSKSNNDTISNYLHLDVSANDLLMYSIHQQLVHTV